MEEGKKDDVERLVTREANYLELQILSRRLDILEKELLADMENRKRFFECTLSVIYKLIEDEHYEHVEKLYDRISHMFEGKIGHIIEEFEFIKINE